MNEESEVKLSKEFRDLLDSVELLLESVRTRIQHYVYEDRDVRKVLKLQSLEKTLKRIKELMNVNQALLNL